MWLDNGLCKLCLIYSRTKDIITLGKEDVLPDLLLNLANIIKTGRGRSYVFATTFNMVKRLTDSEDPYATIKAKLDEVGKKLSTIVEKYLEERGWDITEALRLSAAANIVDTSVLGYEAKSLEEAIWDRPVIEEKISIPKNKNVYVVLDNVGEAAVDLLLVKALKIHGYSVSIAVRRESYEIDVTVLDLRDANDIHIVEVPGNLSPVFYINEGFIIAKGIANAEAYIEVGRVPSLHLLRAKCDVIAQRFNVPKNSTLIVSGDTLKKVLMSKIIT